MCLTQGAAAVDSIAQRLNGLISEILNPISPPLHDKQINFLRYMDYTRGADVISTRQGKNI
jgi:hypothetical protein